MTQSALIRPAWTPATIALMILGFMIFWPLGLAMLAYIIWGERLDGFKRDLNKTTDDIAASFKGRGYSPQRSARTGNVAFDDWREAELNRLHEERMKLDEMRAEFDEYSRELRRAKDQEDFDRFMSGRNAPEAPKSSDAKASKKKDKYVPRITDED